MNYVHTKIRKIGRGSILVLFVSLLVFVSSSTKGPGVNTNLPGLRVKIERHHGSSTKRGTQDTQLILIGIHS